MSDGPPENGSPYLWLVGVALAMTGSICSTLGVNIQKYTFKKNEALSAGEQRPYYKQPLWVLGLILVVVGSLGDFSALGFAAQSIVAPVGSSTLVANLVFAIIWLKESINRNDIAGTALILTGSIIAVVFGNHEELLYTLDEILALYKGGLFIAYSVVVVAFIGAMAIIVARCETLLSTIKTKQQQLDNRDRIMPPERVGALCQEMVHLDAEYAKVAKVHPFSLCSLSGTLGAQSILFAKCMSLLLRRTFEGDNQFVYGLTYVFILACGCTIFGQLHFLAMALQRFDALYVVPVFQCAFIGVSTLGGVCFFQEIQSFGVAQSILFPSGLLMTLAGVYLLSQRKMSGQMAYRQPEGRGISLAQQISNRAGSVAFRRSYFHTRKSAEEFNDDMEAVQTITPLIMPALKLRRSLTRDDFGDVMKEVSWCELSSVAGKSMSDHEISAVVN
ncbi:Magnesium transporter [Plasmodiophora brassicae]|uniref:Magnesium transporter n=1 Tax=Plasmodiophora brassicae TaxID=37360 RepID=A0A0G4IJ39_PLABS|nr:hypothetical protein PBRA_004022 [Plasmodiophora brassicae]SPQ96293.1 unnamed protein product [Plasmodiophora brassicae]